MLHKLVILLVSTLCVAMVTPGQGQEITKPRSTTDRLSAFYNGAVGTAIWRVDVKYKP